jgi:CBS domain-containing protein
MSTMAFVGVVFCLASTLCIDELAYPPVHPGHALEDALQRMEDVSVPAEALLERSDVRHVCGIVTLADVRSAFQQRH